MNPLELIDTLAVDAQRFPIAAGGANMFIVGEPDWWAAFSPTNDHERCADATHRYILCRVWEPTLPLLAATMLNPSTASHLKLDPTITKLCEFAKRNGYGGLLVTNLFAWRATDPDELLVSPAPIGGELTDAVIEWAATKACASSMAGWGRVHKKHEGRARDVERLLTRGGHPRCLGVNGDGSPRHPLYLSYSTPLLLLAHARANLRDGLKNGLPAAQATP